MSVFTAEGNQMYEYRAKVIRVVDGDTVEVDVDLGFQIHTKMMLRLYGINAPEMKGPSRVAGQAAKMFLQDLIQQYNGVLKIRTLQDEQEKYGRYLAYLVFPDEAIANTVMVQTGHAVEATYR